MEIFAKRIFDMVFSMVGLIIALPLMIIIAVLIKLDSRGPVIFAQRRIGKNQSHFNMYKFRSMHTGTPDLPTDQMVNRPSPVTRFGRILRRTSFDEIPQLVNVLLGQMSLVGPRPALYNQYELIRMREERGVHAFKPGITGWAQINGRDDLDDATKVDLDAFYVRNFSLWFDLRILIGTVVPVFRAHGNK